MKSIRRTDTVLQSNPMISSITTNDLTLSINSNDSTNEKSTYDNLTNSLHYPINKKSHQHSINEEYDNYPIIITNQHQNSLGNFHLFIISI